MATDLRLPQLGDIMTEGRLIEWLLPDGAAVQAGQPLYELETDKVSYTIDAPVAGVLYQVVPADTVVPVGAVVGRLLQAGETVPAGPAPVVAIPAATVVQPPSDPSSVVSGDVLATPAARRLARELGVDLAAIRRSGRIREADVWAHHARGDS